ncbi:MAG: 1-(5-phosphoribosyl)-5-[(5-phosphoribosylamino)methylideneamino]imidazole-4-carboxamide isomerase [Candidatus Omnitrophota bacterium]|nr:MAG: 1-(5-phosphoribosyl)-5-[(5-phosphoribosylamino)methylideneamino]imidazole-4-carboxamide isomerase [Candidatus Omnitrophota bacterium]
MNIIPAIDIIDKKVVRLERGEFDKVKIYSENPVLIAKKWVDLGAKLLHIVDLEGARLGKPVNTDVINEIIMNVRVPVELGGGLRKKEHIDTAFNIGVRFVILGTSGINDEELCKFLVKRFGERIIFSVDVKAGKVAVEGWKKLAEQDALEYIKKVEGLGAKRIIYTDISRDGMMTGPNLETLKSILQATLLKVTVSGGISNIEHIRALKELEKDGLDGVIVGKALYEGELDLKNALEEAL